VFHGILGLLLLLGDVWAIINIAQSRETNGAKALWVVLVLVLPVLGLLIWYVAGPKGASA
jgi:succinate dehydrogenase/fumarate reductase cytochrome b subunit